MQISDDEALQILKLRTLIARAAQTDSLQWWDDESITTSGSYLLERVFLGAPAITGRNLAHIAAVCRHQAALKDLVGALHLFHLSTDNLEEEALKSVRLYTTDDLENLTPINNLDLLRQKLLTIIGTEPQYEVLHHSTLNRSLQVRPLASSRGILDYAYTLAWAYLQGKMGQPVFPYILEKRP